MEEQGVPFDCLTNTLKGVQDALHRLAGHFAGCGEGSEPIPPLVRTQSALRVRNARQGSLVLEAALGTREGQDQLLEDHGQRALETLLDWDGKEDARLPSNVTAPLRDVQRSLPPDLRVFLGDGNGNTRRLELEPIEHVRQARPDPEEAALEGWLKEVNWKENTAQLHRAVGRHVVLRFDPALDERMREFANQYVGIIGTGRFGKDDQWGRVAVQQIKRAHPAEPFDLEEFLADPNPRAFEPDRLVTIDLTEEEWASFRHAIREGREV